MALDPALFGAETLTVGRTTLAAWTIAAVATAGVIVRPWRLPEAIWAAAGALLLVLLGLLPADDALAGILKGTDVYLFLIGMMVLAELARQEKLFDWLATVAVRHAKGSGRRLFALVYGVGIVVTVFLSNDATAVVLTPAVYAAARAAGAPALPYLFVCAFIANAASFVLPISNPANLVIFGDRMPPLATWLATFTLPSIAAIALTYIALRLMLRRSIPATLAATVPETRLTREGRLAAIGIGCTALVLIAASALGWELGLPTFLAGIGTATAILAVGGRSPLPVLRHVSWSVLPLVAGLFVLVEALQKTGVIGLLAGVVAHFAAESIAWTAAGAAVAVAVASNLMNNLPVGLIAGSTAAAVGLHDHIAGAVLIAVDLGPNLSVTGSLATILWLTALRREGEHVGAWQFLKLGLVVMPPALAGALLAHALTAP
ncbi:arsenite efflux membrane protein ArsB (TC 3.A.4.1.1 TC 2.A.45.1.1) [Pseudoxanthobacter soli DSM 19599]|uniref:Arsenite efflux membrane protein ArsB (TC 3.A.4.1.1 TC 2.A.45.1.1) n=1 Tax=Pseudoxanthobacter soli DSM 19599 TaxID=1123029 RepID=A0A1M7ZMY1_9HYPH|nr:arsenic transporter [Pseudoxanthobacter soli]SHO66260.1 arsenite efflux membrane protein ArsB (TC 3.A.4.1.1 TC 2.A.45.1.1) [Pseudoxanthobacter soli DSM 19599]